MANDLPGLIIPIEARIDRMERSLKKASQAQQRFAREASVRAKKNADDIAKAYDGLGGRLSASFAKLKIPGGPAGLSGAVAGSGVVLAANQIRETVRGIAEIGDEAKRAGVAVEDFQRWKAVAEQNRIGVDALTDGFKELNLRADEFIVTGKGSAEEAFTRLGFTAEDLAKRLKNPSDLMLEIVKRVEGMNTAARIRIADEVFGGTGGERFVELLGKGEAGVRRMLEDASVLSAAQIDQAAELDRRYNALMQTLGNGWKRASLGAADFAAQVLGIRQNIEELEASDMFRNAGQAPAILGAGVTDALAGNGQAVADHARQITGLLTEYERFAAEANNLAPILQKFSGELRRMGETEAAEALFDAALGTQRLTEELDRGEIEADDFEAAMRELIDRAQDAMSSVSAIDNVRFQRVIDRLAGLGGALDVLKAKAAELRAALPGGDGGAVRADADAHITAMNRHRAAVEDFTKAENARNTATSEQIRLQREADAVRKRAEEAGVKLTDDQVNSYAGQAVAGEDARRAADKAARGGAGGGGGGAGGGRTESDFARAVENLQQEQRQLEAEAAAFIAAAAAGRDYADALELARTKAELLNAAQRDGRAITPELRAEVDRLAEAYVETANKTEEATDAQKKIEDQGKRGADALTDTFMAVLDGSKSASEAVADLLRQIASQQFSNMLSGLFGAGGAGSGVASWLGGLLGFADGGFTGHGGKFEPAGVVHKGEFVFSQKTVQRLGVGNLEALHRSALKGYSGGGLVGSGATAKTAGRLMGREKSSTPELNVSISSPVTVNGSAGTHEQNADLARQVARETEASMRGLIQQEIVRQFRPGGLMR